MAFVCDTMLTLAYIIPIQYGGIIFLYVHRTVFPVYSHQLFVYLKNKADNSLMYRPGRDGRRTCVHTAACPRPRPSPFYRTNYNVNNPQRELDSDSRIKTLSRPPGGKINRIGL